MANTFFTSLSECNVLKYLEISSLGGFSHYVMTSVIIFALPFKCLGTVTLLFVFKRSIFTKATFI